MTFYTFDFKVFQRCEPYVFNAGIGKSLLFNLALVVFLFDVVTIVSAGLYLKHFSGLST